MGDLEKQVVVNGGKKEAEEEEKLLMEGMSVLDFDMLCSTVAMQTQGKYWAKLESNEEEDDDLNHYSNGGGGFRMWEGEVLDCFDDRRIAIESLCCPCYRFGKNMRRAGFGSCFLQGTAYYSLGLSALLNFIAFTVTMRRCFLYLSVAFTFLLGIYLGFLRAQMRKKFNIRLDLGNQLASSEEHQPDTITYLFASEFDHMPSRNLLDRLETRDFYVSFRQEAISLILQAQYSCVCGPFVPYLAVNFMDRFISRIEIPEGKPWILRLLVVSCLSLAAKMENTDFSVCNFQGDEAGFIFDSKTISRMELLILDTLDWRMRSITPFSFVHFFISLSHLKDPALAQTLKGRATKIILKAQNEIKLLKFKPSVIAAAALLVASNELLPLQLPSFKCSISSIECVNEENLLNCFDTLQEMVLENE